MASTSRSTQQSLLLTHILDQAEENTRAVATDIINRLRRCRDPDGALVVGGGTRPYRYAPISATEMHRLLLPCLPKATRDALSAGIFPPGDDDSDSWLSDTIMDNFITFAAQDACRTAPSRIWRSLNSFTCQSFIGHQNTLRTAMRNHGRAGEPARAARRTLYTWLRTCWERLAFRDAGEFFDTCQGIIVPWCHQQNHWTLLVISGRSRTIRVMDSLRRLTRPEYDFAMALLQCGLGDQFAAMDWSLGEVETRQQTDDVSCGVFVCLNALSLCKGAVAKGFIDSTSKPTLSRCRSRGSARNPNLIR
ncbi:Ulp1 protease-like protein 2 [Elsinoe australis]|uniref:Ulp1 protease-like protein 2 n=1 Tax=Elsinoe australis TaxID=40998 RepID=A0A4U7BA55_9PEZI|nr:Ulp1 protease-like protein 2 [Elsinoe australis]